MTVPAAFLPPPKRERKHFTDEPLFEAWRLPVAPRSQRRSWKDHALCVDCGLDTTPTTNGRAHLGKWEWYIVHDALWEAAGMDELGGCLCIGCLERRLGRRLRPDDFDPGAPVNRPGPTDTPRLADRKAGRG